MAFIGRLKACLSMPEKPAKRSISALDLLAIVSELKGIVGGRVDKVYRAGEAHYFRVKVKEGYIYLIAEPRRFSQTWAIPTNTAPSPLRQFIKGCIISSIETPLDRVVDVGLSCGALHIELVPPFNIVFEQGGVVKWVLRQYEGKDRVVKVGEQYRPPPRRFLDPRFFNNLYDAVAQHGLGPEALSRGLGIGPDWAREICHRSGCRDLIEVWLTLRSILAELYLGELRPMVHSLNGQDYPTPIPFQSLGGGKPYNGTFNRLIDEYYGPIEAAELARESVKSLEAEVKRLESSIRSLEEDIGEYRAKANEYRAIGRAIMDNLYDLEVFLEKLREIYSGSKSSFREVVKGFKVGAVEYVDFNPASKTLKARINGVEVELNLFEKPGDAAGRYFNEAKKLDKKVEAAEAKLNELRARLNEVRARVGEEEARVRESVRRISAVEWFERFRWFITTTGLPVLGGRDAGQNETLVKRYMNEWDLFIHADIPGASVVVLKVPKGVEPDQQSILEASQFAASYSKAWKMGINSIDVFYAKGSQVTKQAPSGEYLVKGSFMVYGKRGWVKGVELGLGIGVRVDEGVVRVVSAPVQAIGRLAKYFILIKPGGLGTLEAARRIREMFIKAVAEARSLTVDDIVRALPGPSTIVGDGLGNPLEWVKVKEAFSLGNLDNK